MAVKMVPETKPVLLNAFPADLHRRMKVISAARGISLIDVYTEAVSDFIQGSWEHWVVGKD